MRKRIIFVLSLTAILVYFINSCVNESVESHVWSFEDEKETLVRKAMKKYNELTADDGFVELRSSNGNGNGNNGNGNGNNGNGNGNNGNGNGNNGNGNGNNGNGNNGNDGNGNNGKGNKAVKPLWNYSSIEQDNTYQAVEVILQMETVFNFATPESYEMFEKSKKHEYVLSKTSMIYLVHKKTGAELMFLMTIIPDLSYLESTKFEPFKKMSYLKRDKKFNGVIIYHNMEGKYVNGWRYNDGEITGTIEVQAEKPDFELITTRSSHCTIYWWAEITASCYYSGYMSSGESFWNHVTCKDYVIDFTYYMECDGYGPGSGGIATPPELPSPCVKGSGANTYNNNRFDHSRVESLDFIDKMCNFFLGKMSDNVEWARSMSSSGNFSTPNSGTATSCPVPNITNMESHGHSHPNGSGAGPSVGDLYTFLEMVAQNPSLLSAYSFGKGYNGIDEVYAINVYDRNAVLNFLANYPRNSNYNQTSGTFIGDIWADYDKVRIDYNTSGNSIQVTHPSDSYTYALAYVMNKYNMGVTMSRKVLNDDSKRFETISVGYQLNSNTNLNITNCQ